MNETIKNAILAEIEAAETIIVSRHRRPDGDAVGSTMGLTEILKTSFPKKRIFLDNEDYSEYMAFLGDEGPRPEDADYENALVIVLDTGTLDRISNARVLNGRMLVKIDHHIDNKPYGDISWVEEERSSVCEMVTEFFMSFEDRLKISKKGALCLYTGLVTDSGRFKYRGTAESTLLAAARLLREGIDIEKLYANLYMEDLKITLFNARMTEKIQMTEHGVAYLRISKALREEEGLSQEEASNVVGLMDAIRGSLIWLAFIENEDGSTRVRLRSRFVEVEELAGHYHGGGHACASGATVYSEEELERLLSDADQLLKDYREAHPDLI